MSQASVETTVPETSAPVLRVVEDLSPRAVNISAVFEVHDETQRAKDAQEEQKMEVALAIAHFLGRVWGDRPDWHDRARCSELDLDIFFPGSGGTGKLARAICDQCLVVDECLDYALTNYEDAGIWGETSDRERRYLRKDKADLTGE